LTACTWLSNIAAMLISFLALIALVNGIFGGIHKPHHSLVSFKPGASLWRDLCTHRLRGSAFPGTIVLSWEPSGNAHGHSMNWWPTACSARKKACFDPRSFAIATFALCGFAQLQFDRHSDWRHQRSGAEQSGGELAKLGFRAMIAGTMANLMSASIVGILLQ